MTERMRTHIIIHKHNGSRSISLPSHLIDQALFLFARLLINSSRYHRGRVGLEAVRIMYQKEVRREGDRDWLTCRPVELPGD